MNDEDSKVAGVRDPDFAIRVKRMGCLVLFVLCGTLWSCGYACGAWLR